MVKQQEIRPESVAAALGKILGSQTMRGKETLGVLLSYLVDKTLDGSAGSLKEYTIGVEAFGKPASYNPQEDASVRVQIGRLRQKLEDYYRTEGARDVLAAWITSHDNQFFAQVMVNRVWMDLMERGLVEPVDDLRASNPPSNGLRLRPRSWPATRLKSHYSF